MLTSFDHTLSTSSDSVCRVNPHRVDLAGMSVDRHCKTVARSRHRHLQAAAADFELDIARQRSPSARACARQRRAIGSAWRCAGDTAMRRGRQRGFERRRDRGHFLECRRRFDEGSAVARFQHLVEIGGVEAPGAEVRLRRAAT